eukprot:2266-Heterococcus_DN1.PRE.3
MPQQQQQWLTQAEASLPLHNRCTTVAMLCSKGFKVMLSAIAQAPQCADYPCSAVAAVGVL